MEKSVSQIRLIVEMFSTQRSKNQSHNEGPTFDVAPERLQKLETLFEWQTWAKLRWFIKSQNRIDRQIDKYGHELDYKSNLYCRH